MQAARRCPPACTAMAPGPHDEPTEIGRVQPVDVLFGKRQQHLLLVDPLGGGEPHEYRVTSGHRVESVDHRFDSAWLRWPGDVRGRTDADLSALGDLHVDVAHTRRDRHRRGSCPARPVGPAATSRSPGRPSSILIVRRRVRRRVLVPSGLLVTKVTLTGEHDHDTGRVSGFNDLLIAHRSHRVGRRTSTPALVSDSRPSAKGKNASEAPPHCPERTGRPFRRRCWPRRRATAGPHRCPPPRRQRASTMALEVVRAQTRQAMAEVFRAVEAVGLVFWVTHSPFTDRHEELVRVLHQGGVSEGPHR